MTAKKPSRSAKQAGGRVTPKGTQPAGSGTANQPGKPTGGAHREVPQRFDPVGNRQFAGRPGPNRSASRGNR